MDNSIICLLVFFLSIFASLSTTKADLDPTTIVFMEKYEYTDNQGAKIGNFLFRGNQPKIFENGTHVFGYEKLRKFLNDELYQKEGTYLPLDFYLIDIKFIYNMDDPFERADILLDENFFAQNPSLGEVRFEVILGDDSDPHFEFPKEREKKARKLSSWQHDNLPVEIPKLRQLLYTEANKPVVIYIHCEHGTDRTGEIAGSYAMKYLKMGYQSVIDWNEKIGKRHLLPNHKWAIAWYCYYLSLVEKFDLHCGIV